MQEERTFWEEWENKNTDAAGYVKPAMRRHYTQEELREVAGFYTIGPGAKKDRQTDRKIGRQKDRQFKGMAVRYVSMFV